LEKIQPQFKAEATSKNILNFPCSKGKFKMFSC